MRSFEVPGASPADFVDRVARALVEAELADHVKLQLIGDEIVARLRWLGTTELRYRVDRHEDGFRAELAQQKIAPLHGAFRRAFDERFERILAELGARLL